MKETNNNNVRANLVKPNVKKVIKNKNLPFFKFSKPFKNKKYQQKWQTNKFQKPKKKKIFWRERLALRKKNPDNRRYMAFYLRTKNNVFITITTAKGRVVTSQSAGSCKITTKKKKRSWDTLKAVSISAAKIARLKNIKYIFKFFTTSTYKKATKIIVDSFKDMGLRTLRCAIFRSRPHSLPMRKKKAKRL